MVDLLVWPSLRVIEAVAFRVAVCVGLAEDKKRVADMVQEMDNARAVVVVVVVARIVLLWALVGRVLLATVAAGVLGLA